MSVFIDMDCSDNNINNDTDGDSNESSQWETTDDDSDDSNNPDDSSNYSDVHDGMDDLCECDENYYNHNSAVQNVLGTSHYSARIENDNVYREYQNLLYDRIKDLLPEQCSRYFTREFFDTISNIIYRCTTGVIIMNKVQHVRIIFNNIASEIFNVPLQFISMILNTYIEQSEYVNLGYNLIEASKQHYEERRSEFEHIDTESISMVQVNDAGHETGVTASLAEFQQHYGLTFHDQNILNLLDNNETFTTSIDIGSQPISNSRATGAQVMTREETDNLDRCSMFDIIVRDGDEKTCKICHEDLTDADTVTRISCQHLFHHNCLRVWLENRAPVCPICRINLHS